MGVKGHNCEILRHQATINVVLESGDQDKTYFVDLTENHYKALVNVRITDVATAEVVLKVVITDRNGVEQSEDIPIFPTVVAGLRGNVVLQIEDARSISIRKIGGLGVRGSIEVIKDFCICCL